MFTKNRDRMLGTEISRQVMVAILAHREGAPLLSDEHFSVDGTQVKGEPLERRRPSGSNRRHRRSGRWREDGDRREGQRRETMANGVDEEFPRQGRCGLA